MPTWVLIPAKSLRDGKSRLSPPLHPKARRELNESFLRHMARAASDFAGAARTAIISECADTLRIAQALGSHSIKQTRKGGLNSAVAQGINELRAMGAEDILVVASDLPLVRALDLREVAKQGGSRRVVICPDKWGTGTNAIFVPAGANLCFSFGPGSCAAHLREVRRRGAIPIRYFNWRIALDIDDPADLKDWKEKWALRHDERTYWTSGMSGRATSRSSTAR
jgi:2-phospho-L-lactate/phosphoenolpyruvate guanylyltransferase